jgi:hypothetical protein
MTSSVSPAGWPQGTLARPHVPTPAPRSGRHSASEFAQVMDTVAAEFDLDRHGRHAEPEWNRELFDPRRDDDPFDWLGFDAEQTDR